MVSPFPTSQWTARITKLRLWIRSFPTCTPVKRLPNTGNTLNFDVFTTRRQENAANTEGSATRKTKNCRNAKHRRHRGEMHLECIGQAVKNDAIGMSVVMRVYIMSEPIATARSSSALQLPVDMHVAHDQAEAPLKPQALNARREAQRALTARRRNGLV